VKSSSPWFVAGLIARTLAGAALALLYAPMSGRETMEAIRAHLRNAQDEAREAGLRAEADILQRYKSIRNASTESAPGAPSLAPVVSGAS
jgi:gas vesicle protein